MDTTLPKRPRKHRSLGIYVDHESSYREALGMAGIKKRREGLPQYGAGKIYELALRYWRDTSPEGAVLYALWREEERRGSEANGE